MRIHLYSPVHFEKWDWRNSIEKGIGGSETAATEMAWRLARRGHQVTSYAPIPDDCPTPWRDTDWRRLEDADFYAPGLWVVFRDATCLDALPKTAGQEVWLVCQDEVPVGLTAERAAKIDRVLAYCQWHKRHMERHLPDVRGKVCVTSNGLKLDLIRQVESEPTPPRNPKRLMYASSPDRGLLPLLRIFRRAREFVPDLELHCFYGLNNIEKLIEYRPQFSHYKAFVADLKRELDQPGVNWHGRVSQVELYREWLKSGIWCYPCSGFSETSAITCMEAQALGAIPITCPRAALGENVRHGVFIEGDAHGDPLTRARYVAEIVRLCWYPQAQEDIRREMMPEARARFTWERRVDQWEGWMHGWDGRMHVAQFAFQLKHAEGRVLNVGCADDPAGLGERGVNLDAMAAIPWSGQPTKADVLHDARQALPDLGGSFDTAVCGDILEHLTDDDAVRVLGNAKAVLNEGGRIVLTVPEDYRPPEAQHRQAGLAYLNGESAYHERPITRDVIDGWLGRAGLRTVCHQAIDYGHCEGHGVVATVNGNGS
jgi:glycosyltransferase involved in cell wall biosynthesis